MNRPRTITLLLRLLSVIILLSLSPGCSSPRDLSLTSPNEQLRLELLSENGEIQYRLIREDQELLEWSALGLILDQMDLSKELKLEQVSALEVVKDDYTLLHGKARSIHYQANQKTFTFANPSGQQMTLIFRLSNDGLAFQYHLEGEGEEIYTINEELTSFNLPASAKAWMQPIAEVNTGWEGSNPSYEEEYQMGVPVGTPSPIRAGWVYPALFETDGAWLLISEAGLGRDYCGSRLAADSPEGEYSLIFPSDEEAFPGGPAKPTGTFPWSSPWRIIAAGDLKTVVESTLGTDLAEEQLKEDMSFVLPGQAAWSWALGKDNSITYDIQKEHIDFAAAMGYEHCLIDVNWDTTIGYEKIQELVTYASEQGVKVHLWYNSAGSWNTTPYHPRGMLLEAEGRQAEFQKIADMGVAGVKIDFFGGDGQSMIGYYIDILEDAADAKLMVNFHGTTLPRGWARTYPHLMTMEAVKGFEMITFEQAFADRAARHCLVLPFTRNVFDPMDFTPMSLDEIPNIDRKTSKGFELALTVIFESGIQHLAESPEGSFKQEGFVLHYLTSLPGTWEETNFIQGYPGDYAVMARKGDDHWYLAGINAGEAKKLSLDLSFAGTGSSWILIMDSADGQALVQKNLSNTQLAAIDFPSNSGFVLFQTN